MFEVLLFTGARNEQVVYVGVTERKSLGDMVDKSLECLRCVPEAERHAQIFIQAKRRNNCSLRDVGRLDRYLVIGFHQVYLSEYCHAMQGACEVRHVR